MEWHAGSTSCLFYGQEVLIPVGGGGRGCEKEGNTLEEIHAFLVLSYFVSSPLSCQLAKQAILDIQRE